MVVPNLCRYCVIEGPSVSIKEKDFCSCLVAIAYGESCTVLCRSLVVMYFKDCATQSVLTMQMLDMCKCSCEAFPKLHHAVLKLHSN